MPQYDLAGNPLPEPAASASSASPAEGETLTDLSGNPLPTAARPAVPTPGALPPSFTAPPPSGGAYRPASPSSSAAPPRSPVALAAGLSVAAVALLALIFFARATRHEPVTVPTGFLPYTAQDKSFTCVAPGGWKTIGAGTEGSNLGGALFKTGDAKIDITSDLAGSLMSDILKTPANPLEGENAPPPPPPVEKLHKMGKRAVKEKYSGYKEGEMTKSQGAMGEICTSEWTADGGLFGAKLHGWRVTMLGHERRVTVICESAQADWAKLKPVFARVIGSIADGPG